MANIRKSKGYVDAVDFGSVTSGYTFSGEIPFRNSSNIPIKITAEVEGADKNHFSVKGIKTFEEFIPARTQYELPLSFSPDSSRSYSSKIKCSFNNGTVPINGSPYHYINLSGSSEDSVPTPASFKIKSDEYPLDSRNIIVELSPRSDVDYYEIHYSLSPSSGWIKASEYNGQSSEFTILELEFNTKYYILVKSFNIHGHSNSEIKSITTKIHTLPVEISGIVPNLNIHDKVLGQGSNIHYFQDVELTIFQSSIIYCDKCNTVNERAFNDGFPYQYETTYTPSMPDLPSFSQAKPALTTGPKIMDDLRQLPLTIQIYGQILGSGGVGGNGSGQNSMDSRYVIPPNLVRSQGVAASMDSTGRKPGVTGPQFLEGGDAIHVEYDCVLNIHSSGKVKGGGGGGYGGGISWHTGYGATNAGAVGAGDGYTAYNVASAGIGWKGSGSWTGHNGQWTPAHYHGRKGDKYNTGMISWINSGKLSTTNLDACWNLIDHSAPKVADDDNQTDKDHVDWFSITSYWPSQWKGGTSQDSINPDTGSRMAPQKIFLGGGGGGGGQGFAAGKGGKAGSCSLSRQRSHQTGSQNKGANVVAYGHLGQVLEGSMPFQRGDNATKDFAGGPSGHYKSPLYRIQSEGMNADSLRAKGPYPSEDGNRQRYGEGLWAFFVQVNVHKRRWRRRVRTHSYFRSGRAIMDIRGGAGGSYGLYGEERPVDSSFSSGNSRKMINMSAGSASRDLRNRGRDTFSRGYVATDISPAVVGPNNPLTPRADVWNVFQFKCLGGDVIDLYSLGTQMPHDPSGTLSQSFKNLFSTAIFMDKDQSSAGYWNRPSIIAKPSSFFKSGVYKLKFPHGTFSSYSAGDTGIIGTVKPHGFPGKAIVLNGHKVSGLGWSIGCHNDERIAGLVCPSRVPRLNKFSNSGKIFNRDYRSFF